MTFDRYLEELNRTSFAGFVDGHPDVLILAGNLARALIEVPTEVQVVALSLYLGQVWAAAVNDHIRLDDGTVFLLDLEKRLAIFGATAGAGYAEAMKHLPAIFAELHKVFGKPGAH